MRHIAQKIKKAVPIHIGTASYCLLTVFGLACTACDAYCTGLISKASFQKHLHRVRVAAVRAAFVLIAPDNAPAK
jgi:hypothetical protein